MSRTTAMMGIWAFVLSLFVPELGLAQGKKYALLVGVETYDPAFLTRLKFADDDAREMAAALESLGFEVTLMTRDAEIPARRPATAEKILRQLQARLTGLKAADTLIVSLSGHGVQFKSPRKLADGTEESQFFCPEEADLTQPDTLVPVGRIYTMLESCPAERKLLIVDACRNEVLSEGARSADEIELEPAGVTPRSVPKGMLALYSCAEGEKSFEQPDLSHGVFCYHVLKYLKGEADASHYTRGQATIRGLADFASRETRDFVLEKLNADQFPELVGRTSDWGLGPVERKKFTNTLGMKFTLIPPGKFRMGSVATQRTAIVRAFPALATLDWSSEDPVEVSISRGFFLSAHEVTRGQFARFVAETGYRTEAERSEKGGFGFNAGKRSYEQGPQYNWRNLGFKQTDDHPAVGVSWNDAQEFCRWLGRKEGRDYRLPTEAEWEYACRAGSDRLYWFGDDIAQLGKHGNTGDARWSRQYSIGNIDLSFGKHDDGFTFTAPVGSYPANRFGLFDMHGNASEWCTDWYAVPLPGGIDPEVVAATQQRTTRGGHWGASPAFCRSASRGSYTPSFSNADSGFRVAARGEE
jgi:formylglycine-generating enzyme required for sulfatase activity